MEMNKLFLVAIALVVCFAAFADSKNTPVTFNNEKNGPMSWCIARPPTDSSSLNSNIDFSCHQGGVNCSPIQPGGSCFSPDSLHSHASYVMHLYYLKAGMHAWNCDFKGTGLIVTQNPSLGPCNYPEQ